MKTILVVVTALVVVVAVVMSCAPPTPEPFGHFVGTVESRWLPDGRGMELLSDFAYVDTGKTRWNAPSGALVDGASIPQVFWTFIGGPFEGKYRDASVLHDVACETRDRDWHAVHRMFYEACRCGGVGDVKARLMYAAVYHFGPRWGDNLEMETRLQSEDDFERLQLAVASDPELGVRAIERLTSVQLRQRVPVLPQRAQPESLALPHLESALPPGTGRGIRKSGGADGLVLFVRDDQERSIAEEALLRTRAAAESTIAVNTAAVEKRLGEARTPEDRARLASDLLELSRQRAAVSRVGVRVTVGTPPPP